MSGAMEFSLEKARRFIESDDVASRPAKCVAMLGAALARIEELEAERNEARDEWSSPQRSSSMAFAVRDLCGLFVCPYNHSNPAAVRWVRDRVRELQSGQLAPAARGGYRFWSDDTEGAGFWWHRTWQDARNAALDAIKEWSEPEHSVDGQWSECIEFVRWGVVVEEASPVRVEDPGTGAEYVLRWELRAIESEPEDANEHERD